MNQQQRTLIDPDLLRERYVNLRDAHKPYDVDDGSKPHDSTEDVARVLITAIDPGSGHHRLRQQQRCSLGVTRLPPGGLGVGRG
jgi:hypothetical protein